VRIVSDGSAWRRDLAEKIAPAYAANRKVAAVAITGSVSRGWADRYSDVEISVFWSEAPSKEERRAAARTVGADALRLWPYDSRNQDWSEDYLVRGVKIDVSHRTVETTARILADVVDRYETTVSKQNLVSAVLHGKPLAGASLLDEWRAKAARYPDGLARSMVREHLGFGPHWWLEMLAERKDLLPLYEIFCAAEKLILCVLMGLNRIYHPGFKWMDRLIADMAARSKQVFRAEPLEGVHMLRHLIDEMFFLIDMSMPEVDISGARERFEQCREPIEKAPEGGCHDANTRATTQVARGVGGDKWSDRWTADCGRRDYSPRDGGRRRPAIGSWWDASRQSGGHEFG